MNKEIIIPPFLKEGDKAVIISPSGNIDSILIDGAKIVLNSWGLKVETAPHAKNQQGRFCGSVNERLADIQNAINDTKTKLIFCSRGGYGAVHLLDKISFNHFADHPKWLVGYSDITALHQIFWKNNIVSLHAPMAKHLAEEGAEDKANTYLKEILFGQIPQYETDGNILNIEGVCSGTLFGGNLAVLCGLVGSDFFSLPENGILFIEDIGERPYQIDRMMWTLKLAGILAKLKGLIVGKFTGYEEDPLMYASVYESILDMVAEYNIPVSFGFPTGHIKDNYPLLHGCIAKLDVKKDKTTLIQNFDYSYTHN